MNTKDPLDIGHRFVRSYVEDCPIFLETYIYEDDEGRWYSITADQDGGERFNGFIDKDESIEDQAENNTQEK